MSECQTGHRQCTAYLISPKLSGAANLIFHPSTRQHVSLSLSSTPTLSTRLVEQTTSKPQSNRLLDVNGDDVRCFPSTFPLISPTQIGQQQHLLCSHLLALPSRSPALTTGLNHQKYACPSGSTGVRVLSAGAPRDNYNTCGTLSTT